MNCLNPITKKNPAYMKKPNQKPFLFIPCQKCIACLKRKASDWTNRLMVEDKHSASSWFVTLTYMDDKLPVLCVHNDARNYIKRGLVDPRTWSDEQWDDYYDQTPVLVEDDFQGFFKRLRSYTDCNLKYYLAAEYGSETYRPHCHIVLFVDKVINRDHLAELIGRAWPFGMTRLDALSPALIRYACQYVCKLPSQDNYYRLLCELGYPQFALMSKKLGVAYIDDAKLQHDGSPESVYFRLDDGTKSILPRYFREKMYSDRQRKCYADYIQDQNGIPFETDDINVVRKYVRMQKSATRQLQVNDKFKKSLRNKI